jgi:hypothetical protein
MLDFDHSRSNQPHILAPSRLSIQTMSVMDSDLKKRVEKAALIRLAAPFLKVPQAICVGGADNDDADNGATDDDADNDADDNADMQITTPQRKQWMECRQQCHMQTMKPQPRQWATTQTTGKDADKNKSAEEVYAAMQTTR